ncbi:MAG: hypothetical protein IH608_08750, partial [Proteobacteria bacterium]|nr:hypothetical protein [Pseudomonadota bacterium]
RQTQKLLRSAVRMGFLAQARGRRLFQEWVLLLEEVDPVEALEALDEHGALAAFHASLRLSPKTRELLERIRGVVTWFQLLYLETPLRRWLVYLLALLDALGEGEVEELLRSFGVADREGMLVRESRSRGYRALLELREEISRGEPRNSRVYEILRSCEAETLLFLMAKTQDEVKRRLISRYYTHLAGVKPLLRGQDLRALGILPGAVYRELLGGLLRARLDGQVESREDEVAWVRERVGDEGPGTGG